MWDALARVCLPSAPSGHLLRLRCRQAAGVWTRKSQSPQSFVAAVLGSAGGPPPHLLPSQHQARRPTLSPERAQPEAFSLFHYGVEGGGGRGSGWPLEFFFKIYLIWTIKKKAVLNLSQYCFCFIYLSISGREARGILVSQQGIEPTSPALEGEILTTREVPDP